MKNKAGKEVIDLAQQFRNAYAVPYRLKQLPELGEFKVLPMTNGNSLGNLQRMMELDIDGSVTELFDRMKVSQEAREIKTSSAFLYVSQREIVMQRNRMLRAHVIPPEGLRSVWDWSPVKEGDVDPMDEVFPILVLNELFEVVQQVARGTMQLTESGDPVDEEAAGKS